MMPDRMAETIMAWLLTKNMGAMMIGKESENWREKSVENCFVLPVFME